MFPAGWPADARGRSDIIEMDGDVLLSLLSPLDLATEFVASRVS